MLIFIIHCHARETSQTGSNRLVIKLFFLAEVHLQATRMEDSANHLNKTDLKNELTF